MHATNSYCGAPRTRRAKGICRHAVDATCLQQAFNHCIKQADDPQCPPTSRTCVPRCSSSYCALPSLHCGRLEDAGRLQRWRAIREDISADSTCVNLAFTHLAIMFGIRRLVFAAGLAFHAAALPATGPSDEGFECYSSLSAYDSSSREFEEPYATELVSTAVWISTSKDTNVPLTTLCDGRARAIEPYKVVEVTETETLESPVPTALYSTYTEASPTCVIAETACTAIQSAHPDEYVYCETNPPYVPCTSATLGYCFIYANYDPKLYYWPVTTVSGDFCAQNGSTIFAEPTSRPEPNTAIIDGYTFTSPTNYISFSALSAVIHGRRPSRTQCGPPRKTNVVLPITESFYSGGYLDDETWSFNFADLNTLPVEAYNRQRKCGYQHGSCTGVLADEAEYTPIIPLPTEVLNLEPEEWKAAGCRGSVSSYYITPVALATPAPTYVNRKL